MLVFGAAWVGAQEAPKAVDLGLSVQWADVDIAPEVDIPEGWRMPTLAEIKELRENCFLYPIGSRSAREFGIAGSDGCYLKVIILNPLLKAPNRDGYYTWEELGETSLGQRRYPVRLVKE